MAASKLKWRGKEIERRILRGAERGLRQGMELLEGKAVAAVSIGNPPPHKQSAPPGMPPRLRTGVLRASIGQEVRKREPSLLGRFGIRKGPAERYAAALEFGFVGAVFVSGHTRRTPLGTEVHVRSHVRIMSLEARPFLRPTISRNRGRMLDLIRTAIRRELDQGPRAKGR